VQLDGLPAMVQAVLSNDPTVQLEATTHFRKLLSIVVPLFVKLLNSHIEDVHIQTCTELQELLSSIWDSRRVMLMFFSFSFSFCRLYGFR